MDSRYDNNYDNTNGSLMSKQSTSRPSAPWPNRINPIDTSAFNNNNNDCSNLNGDTSSTTNNNNNISISNNNNIQSSNVSMLSNVNSLKDQKKNYYIRKKCFTKNVQSAIESTQEIHSGWLKARTTIKNWTKVWCQLKLGYLIMYTSQEAQKKHRLGVVLLTSCQVIIRPTKKEGFCFKLINPFGCSVWAKSSTRALAFRHASLTLRATDEVVGRLWLDALHRCNLSSNLEGYQSVVDINDEDSKNNNTKRANGSYNQSEISEDGDSVDDDDQTRNFDSLINPSNYTGESNSLSSLRNNNILRPNGNINHSRVKNTDFNNGNSVKAGNDTTNLGQNDRSVHNKLVNRGSNNNNNNNNKYSHQPRSSEQNSSPSKDGHGASYAEVVTKFSKYNWKELNLENVNYICNEIEELGSAGVQSEEVQDSNKNFLWHIIKQLRPGMDLSKVTLPTFILEPRSFLEKLADYYYHCDILSEAVAIDDPLLRLINIVKWYLSGFYKKPKGPKKPYNPILGERFRCFWDHPKTKSRTFFIAEQVSHHPPVSAFHVSNRKDGYTITCALLSRSKFSGNSVSAILDGKATLHLTKRNETYTLTMPYANCRGILLGSLCLELGGKVEIDCADTGCRCELDFKLAAPVWASANSYNSMTGKIMRDNKVTHLLEGHWDKKIDLIDKRTDEKSVLWEVTDAIRNSRLQRYSVDFDHQGDRESVKLWSKVTEALIAGDQTAATAEKTKLEEMQRKEARERQGTFEPRHFGYSQDQSTWTYRWLDNRPWNKLRDIMQFEDDFKIRTLIPANVGDDFPRDLTVDLSLDELGKALPSNNNNNDGVSLTENTRTLMNHQGQRSNDFIGNLRIEQAIKQVTERSKKIEEDIATLKRCKKTVALAMTAIIVAIIGVLFRYFA